MTGLPPSLRRRAGRSIHAREEAVLDNFKISRDMADSVMRGSGEQPTLSDYWRAATDLGFEVRHVDAETIGVLRDGVLLVVLVQDAAGDVTLCPTEGRP